jgi:hypothetical protein
MFFCVNHHHHQYVQYLKQIQSKKNNYFNKQNFLQWKSSFLIKLIYHHYQLLNNNILNPTTNSFINKYPFKNNLINMCGFILVRLHYFELNFKTILDYL